MITQKRLKELLSYDPDTGMFVWVVGRVGASKGAKAGGLCRGYVSVGVDGRKYFAHRLAWLYQKGSWPVEEIDHINHTRSDNRWCNLREVSSSENSRNISKPSDNTSGVVGVSWTRRLGKRNDKWESHIRNNGRRVFIGYFDDFFEAVAARRSAEIKYNYHENHGK